VPPEGIHQIALPTPFRVGDVNTWLLRGDPLTLVDAGPLMDDTEARLDAALAGLGLAVEDLELILLTHQHVDHVGLAGELARRSGAEIAGTAALAAYMADTDASQEADDAYSTTLMHRHGVTAGTVETLHGISRAFRRYTGSAAVRHVVAEGGELVAGGRTWRVHERPGHSPTDTILRGDGVVIGGDHLLGKISSNPIAHLPIGASDPAGLAASPDRPRSLAVYERSLAATAGEDRGELILPGHGDPFTGAAELIERRHGMTERRAEKILASLSEPRTAAAIGRDMWRHVPVTQAYLVLSEVLGHLDLLEQRGRVAAEEHDGLVLYARTG
jgi:glyoxylase-like metal-dependent hydrolase (beta-lactamase superfamily II)